MLSLPLSKEKRKKDWQKILTIANNNKFPKHQIEKLKTQITQKNSKYVNENQTQNEWSIFTYHSPIIRKITNRFKQTDIKIAFRNKNKIRQIIRPKLQDNTQDHDKSGIYKLISKKFNKGYIGQTSSNLTLRYKEHILYIKNNDLQSAYGLHIL